MALSMQYLTELGMEEAQAEELLGIYRETLSELEAEKGGKVMKVVVDRKEGDYYVGRTEYCSPEVDPEVLIPAADRRLRVGQMYDVRITDSEEFDLYGEIVKK